MAAGPIIVYLNWLGNRQAVSVRPVGLSCVEAVKDWVANLRQSPEPFEVWISLLRIEPLRCF